MKNLLLYVCTIYVRNILILFASEESTFTASGGKKIRISSTCNDRLSFHESLEPIFDQNQSYQRSTDPI